MKKSWLGLALGLPLGAAFLAVGCGDDEVFRDGDASTPDGGASTDDASSATPDGSVRDAGSSCGDSTGAPPRALLSINNTSTSELVAFNLDTKKVDGRLTYPGFIGLTSSLGTDPYLLQQSADVVARLDPREPWKVVSSWSVADDAGPGYADPTAMVVPTCGKGYVVRFKRNTISVLDTSKNVDAGAPSKTIDLGALLQPGDTDGLVDMVSAIYVPERKRVFVLLGNIDLRKVAPDGYSIVCKSISPTIIAIDTETDQVVSLGGAGPGGGIALGGYNPPLGTSFAYDAARQKLIVLSAGCNADLGDGGAGNIQRRRVEEVDLGTRAVTTLLSLDDQDFPLGLTYVDATRAAIGFYGQSFFWNPQETKLGAPIRGTLDYFAHDGKGNLVGTRATTFADGGAGPLEVWRIPFGDGGTAGEKLGENPFTDNSGFVSGVEVWPRP
jgi:hypothetical protein